MNTIDMILSQIGQSTDGLGSFWSPLERVVHKFHMKDLWQKLRSYYALIEQVIGTQSFLCHAAICHILLTVTCCTLTA